MPEPTVAAGVVRGLVELAVSKGASPRSLAERSGINPEELRNEDGRIAFAKYVALMRAGQELCGDPALALHFGEAVDLGELSVVGLVGGGIKSMADGLALTNRYAPLVVEPDEGGAGDRFGLRRIAGQLWIVDTRKNPNDFPEMTESTFARIVCTARRLFEGARFVKAIHVTHPAPPYRAEYDRIFQVPVTFESDRNGLLTDDAWMARRVEIPSTYTTKVLKAHADSLLERLEAGRSTRSRVEALLAPALQTGGASIREIAGHLGVSRQTLFRRLKVEGVTFQQILDELRRKMARHYLTAEKLSVKETAYRVGFSEPAAFSRAFKRWTGSSPREVREGLRGTDRATGPRAT
jgi:AraC-like DNA-binding protein